MITLKLTKEEVDFILAKLAKLTIEEAVGIFMNIRQQAMTPPPPTPQERPPVPHSEPSDG